ncbi:hypothetical protein MTO96_033625 [Rhipicephalus appendiculatus]
MSQVDAVDGEDLSPEEMLKWRQTHIYDAAYQDSLRKDAIAATAKAAVWQQMISKKNKVRPPKLPEGSYKAIFRIRGGFNASRFSHFQLSKLLCTTAGLPATMELRQDVVTINATTNTVTLSTESYDRLAKYLAIKSFMVNGQEHEVTSYSVPNSETCKGIIYIDRVCLGEVIEEKDLLPTLRECNPEMHFLEARRMGKTSDAVLVTFLGTKVPFWVKYEMAMLRCKPFRQRMEACTRCWTVGHRPDVCPTNKEETCRKCGTVNPPPDHVCIPKCVLCSGSHETGSLQCALRYKPKTPLPKVDKTPPSPKTKPPLPTKKQGPPPKKKQEEDWPSLSAASPSHKSSPPQVGWLSVASHSSLNAKSPDAPIYALLKQIQEENRALRKQIHDLQTPSLSTNAPLSTTVPAPQPATDKQSNVTTAPIRENDDQTTTMDTTPPPTIGNSTKRKSSDDGRDAWEEHDKLSRKLAAHIRNSNNRFESLEKRMDSVEAKLESLTTIVHDVSTHISAKFSQLDEKFHNVDDRFSQIIERLDRLHGRVP